MDWINDAVMDGLSALVALRLKGTPGEDMIELTADIWVRAFRQRVFIRELDEPRVRVAFDRIFSQVREWPAPLDVIELMPPRPPQKALPPPKISDEEHGKMVARVKLMIGSFMQHWSMPPDKRKTNG
ncbi:hypothetical protein EG829_00540 [bacterium]|nr:hypothetical protein [bacterium]